MDSCSCISLYIGNSCNVILPYSYLIVLLRLLLVPNLALSSFIPAFAFSSWSLLLLTPNLTFSSRQSAPSPRARPCQSRDRQDH